MLHDPKWNRGTLEGLITWFEGKQRDEIYNYANGECCPIRQYMGVALFDTWPQDIRDIYQGSDKHRIAYGMGTKASQTYGQALERAYKACEAVTA